MRAHLGTGQIAGRIGLAHERAANVAAAAIHDPNEILAALDGTRRMRWRSRAEGREQPEHPAMRRGRFLRMGIRLLRRSASVGAGRQSGNFIVKR